MLFRFVGKVRSLSTAAVALRWNQVSVQTATASLLGRTSTITASSLQTPIRTMATKNMSVTSTYIPFESLEPVPTGPMWNHQSALPKLPVPELEETCSLYLESVKPFLTPTEFEHTRKAVEEFKKPGGIGEDLQRRLKEREGKVSTSWLIDWWNENAYMAYRDPVVIYVSYFFAFRDDKKRKNPAARAASIIRGAMQFRDLIINGTLQPDAARSGPLCMYQYLYAFNSTRVPVIPSDVTHNADPNTNNHIIVMRKNQFYVLDLKHHGRHLSVAEIESQLNKIYMMAGDTRFTPVGALTTEDRDTWAKLRDQLLAVSDKNKRNLDIIQRAAFVVCLDDIKPVTREE
ncbi:Carnitine O-acetyltransferase mitochondrial, partial [Quaeritorhiza haematococci]